MFHLPILTELFESLPLGVVVLDADGKVVVYNAAEERLAGRKKDAVMGRKFFVDVVYRPRFLRHRFDCNQAAFNAASSCARRA